MTNYERIGIIHDMPKYSNASEDFTINGKCSRCGACCTNHLRVMPEEIQRIQKYVKRNHLKPCDHTQGTENPHNFIDFMCPFIDTEQAKTKCMIYDVRPAICKHFCCSLDNDPNGMQKFLEGVENDPNIDIESFVGTKEINMQQTFFPKHFVPMRGTKPIVKMPVIINMLYREAYSRFHNRVFIISSDKTRYQNGKLLVLLQDSKEPNNKFWFAVDGVTALQNIDMRRGKIDE